MNVDKFSSMILIKIWLKIDRNSWLFLLIIKTNQQQAGTAFFLPKQ